MRFHSVLTSRSDNLSDPGDRLGYFKAFLLFVRGRIGSLDFLLEEKKAG
jgi:hypothetical protein